MKNNVFEHVVFDLDDTLVYYLDGRDGIFELFTKRGVPEKIVRDAYEETKATNGFNIDKLTARIRECATKRFDKFKIKREFDVWLNNSLKVYNDAADFLSTIRERGVKFSIISAGDESFQKEKVKLARFKPFELHIVPRAGEKAAILRGMIGRGICPIVYVDDKASELDAIRREFDENKVVTVRISRPGGLYKNQKSVYKHREISSIKELEGMGPGFWFPCIKG